MYKNFCVVDIETTPIQPDILDIDKIHCIGIKSNHKPTKIYTSSFLDIENYGGTLENAIDIINSHDYCIGHNFIAFDNIIISNLLGNITANILDTLILSKLIYTKDELKELDLTIKDYPKALYGSFSLDAFGRRMEIYKGSHNNWDELSIDMANYCTQDVEVTYNLFMNLIEHPIYQNYSYDKVIALEHEVACIITKQQYYGFCYDTKNARLFIRDLTHEKLNIELKLQKIFKPKYLPNGNVVIPTKTRKIKQVEGEYQKIKLTKFDPGSRHKIKHWLKTDYGFEFATFTQKGNRKVNGEELQFLPAAVDLMRYLKIVKDLSEVRGVLNEVKADGAVHGRVDTLGAATHRCTHSNPNVAQTSADPIFRTLYIAPKGYKLVGADLANIEIRVLAHYLYKYDGGEYAKAVLTKDMHWYHAGLAGFIDPAIEYDEHNPKHKAARNKSKKFFFGYLYGQGDTIRGHTLWTDGCLTDYTEEEYNLAKERISKRLVNINGTELFPLRKDEYVEFSELLILKTIYGKRTADTFLKYMKGIRELINDCTKQSKEVGYVKAIDGRLLYSRSPHSALNLLLQGSAGIIAKQWMVNYNNIAKEKGLIFGLDYWQSAYIHDEFQCTCLEEHVETLKQALIDGASKVTADFKVNIPIKADAISGSTWSDTH